MSLIFDSAIARALKKTLNSVITDDSDGYESGLIMPKFCKVGSMEDAYEDDVEYGGPGLATEKTEGSEMQSGTIREGAVTRYLARTFALKLAVTEEAMEDAKYPQVINAARRLKRAMFKTIDVDAALMLVRGFDSNYVGGDNVSLWSSSHTLPNGGTYSNTLATPMSPSRQAVIVATSMAKKLPGHDGIVEGYTPIGVTFPTEQWAVWSGLVNSEKAPEAGQFNEINVVNSDLRLKLVENKYWGNTTTNWAMLTDCDNGFKFLYRRRPRSRSWVDNNNEVMLYGISSRWSRGWSDPRCTIGSNV